MRYSIIYDCKNANCRTPIDTGSCSKECIKRYNKEMEKKPKTNADRIRAMRDEELARFLASKFTDETYYRLTKKAHIPTATEIEAIRDYWYDTWLAWLKQPAEGECHSMTMAKL